MAPWASAGAAPSDGLRTVVLDPGHGGEDLGNVSPAGVSERDVAADVCRRVSRIFSERLGTPRVVLTHDRDVAAGPSARTSLANGRKGDVLVSVHVAASVDADARGARVYAMSPRLRVVELAERRLRPRARALVSGAAGDGPEGDLRLTPWAMAQADRAAQSRALADRLSRELTAVTGEAPVRELPLGVLAGARMPAVLVEVGHLSHAAEEERLKSDRYREALAQAIYRGIVGFFYPGGVGEGGTPDEPRDEELP
jgi:N-acetylmuramoyl-L-alanine amidase